MPGPDRSLAHLPLTLRLVLLSSRRCHQESRSLARWERSRAGTETQVPRPAEPGPLHHLHLHILPRATAEPLLLSSPGWGGVGGVYFHLCSLPLGKKKDQVPCPCEAGAKVSSTHGTMAPQLWQLCTAGTTQVSLPGQRRIPIPKRPVRPYQMWMGQQGHWELFPVVPEPAEGAEAVGLPLMAPMTRVPDS